MTKTWQSVCDRCETVYESPETTDTNPYPNGVFCPSCKGKYTVCPVLTFHAVDDERQPQFFAPDQQTPGMAGDAWVRGDVFSYVLDGDLRCVEATRVHANGRLMRGDRITDAEQRFGPEIAAYYGRQDALRRAVSFYATAEWSDVETDHGKIARTALASSASSD